MCSRLWDVASVVVRSAIHPRLQLILFALRLVDASMLPFQTCYLIIYVLIFPILAGNQAMPLFLRMELWIISKFISPGTELDVLVHFLLTHSRRWVNLSYY